MLRDIRHGVRVLMQAKGWTLVVVLSLAVGIGANAAVFTAVNGLLLRKLPVDDPDSLVRLRWGGQNDMSNDSNDYGPNAPGADGQAVHATFSYPMFLDLTANKGRTAVPHLLVDSARRGTYDNDTRQVTALTMLWAVVSLVLMLVCANVANLLLSRAAARQREISVRLSLGATRARLIRQLLTESLMLSAAGGSLGFALARWGQSLLPAPVGTTAPVDWPILVFTAGVTMLTGIVFGIAPALRTTKMDVGIALKENNRTVTGSNTILARVLLVTQVSISVVLLVGAGLFVCTLYNLRNVDVGFDPQNLVFVRVDISAARLNDEGKIQFLQDGMRRLQSVSGVKAATVSFPTLLSGMVNGGAMFVQGRAYPEGLAAYRAERDDIDRVTVASNYFATLGIPVAVGRAFTDLDDSRAPQVAILNQAAARKFFPNENPIGRRIGYSPEDSGKFEIVGIVQDVRYNSLREPPPPTLYVSYLQANRSDLVFTARTTGDPAAFLSTVRSAVGAVNPGIPVVTVETQMSQLERRYAQERVMAQAYSLFGSIALFIAAIGLFGVMSYNVSRRTREIGIRMAMGAPREAVMALVLRESMSLVLGGIIVGLVVAFGAGRLVASQLFGLQSTDPATMAAAVAVMTIVSAAAGYLPTRRATRVDPIVALRYE